MFAELIQPHNYYIPLLITSCLLYIPYRSLFLMFNNDIPKLHYLKWCTTSIFTKHMRSAMDVENNSNNYTLIIIIYYILYYISILTSCCTLPGEINISRFQPLVMYSIQIATCILPGCLMH